MLAQDKMLPGFKVGKHWRFRRATILEWIKVKIEFCLNYTTFKAESVHKTSLRDRLVNLMDRKLIERNGSLNSITETGIDRLRQYSKTIIGWTITTEQTELNKIAHGITKKASET